MGEITLKKALKSRTILFNGFVLIMGFITAILPEIRAFIAPESYGVLLIVISIVNKGLRVVTDQALGDK